MSAPGEESRAEENRRLRAENEALRLQGDTFEAQTEALRAQADALRWQTETLQIQIQELRRTGRKRNGIGMYRALFLNAANPPSRLHGETQRAGRRHIRKIFGGPL